MKKMISLLTALLMAFGVTASAEDSAMENVLMTVKKRVPSTEKFDRMDSRTTVDVNGKTSYRFAWMSENDPDAGELSVTVTESGVITNYYSYGKSYENDDKPSINRKTYEDVLPIARKFVDKINPDIAKSLKISPAGKYESLRKSPYDFVVQRFENGLPVYGEQGYLSVTPDGETVESFYIKYTEGLSFEPAENLISKDAAQTAYGEKIGLKLYYTLWIENGKRTVVPVYSPDTNGNEYINAVTGEIFVPTEPVYNGGNFKYSLEESESVTMDYAANGAFTPAEKAELTAVEGLITKEQAAQNVLENTVLKPGSGYTAQHFNLSKDYYDTDRYYWNISFEGEKGYMDAQVDAVTGRITSFYKNRNYNAEAKITPEKAKETAFAAIALLAPEYFPQDGESPYRPQETENGYSYSWVRYENNVPFDAGNAYVEIDKEDGSVAGYHLAHDDLDFPPVDNVISNYMALKCMFGLIDYDVWYIKTCSAENLTAYDKAVAVFIPENRNMVLRAENGDPLYSYGKEAELEAYTDIAGHFSENAVKLLQKYGVGFSGGKFLPDEVITQKDLTVLLNCIFGRGYSSIVITENTGYTEAYDSAKRNGILKAEEQNPDSPVTRETAAVMIIRAMGLEEAAKLTDIYVCPFADVTQNQGYVSILGAMGVFKGDTQGNFNPNAPITRGETAVMLVNYLNKV